MSHVQDLLQPSSALHKAKGCDEHQVTLVCFKSIRFTAAVYRHNFFMSELVLVVKDQEHWMANTVKEQNGETLPLKHSHKGVHKYFFGPFNVALKD